ncbi:hypothetical protein Dimus_035821, partial [Dionaea muscipula]
GHSRTPLGHEETLVELLNYDTYNVTLGQTGALTQTEQEHHALARAGFGVEEGELPATGGGVVMAGQQLEDENKRVQIPLSDDPTDPEDP